MLFVANDIEHAMEYIDEEWKWTDIPKGSILTVHLYNEYRDILYVDMDDRSFKLPSFFCGGTSNDVIKVGVKMEDIYG